MFQKIRFILGIGLGAIFFLVGWFLLGFGIIFTAGLSSQKNYNSKPLIFSYPLSTVFLIMMISILITYIISGNKLRKRLIGVTILLSFEFLLILFDIIR